MFGASCFGELPFAATRSQFAEGLMTLAGNMMMRDPRLLVLEDESAVVIMAIELYPKPSPDRV